MPTVTKFQSYLPDKVRDRQSVDLNPTELFFQIHFLNVKYVSQHIGLCVKKKFGLQDIWTDRSTDTVSYFRAVWLVQLCL